MIEEVVPDLEDDPESSSILNLSSINLTQRTLDEDTNRPELENFDNSFETLD